MAAIVEGAFVGVVEVVNRERGDDGALLLRKRFGHIVCLGVGDIGIIAEPLFRQREHGRGEVDEVDMRGREALPQQDAQKARACTEIDDAFRLRWNEFEGAGVEAVTAGDEARTVAIVGGGGGVEDSLGIVGHLCLPRVQYKG